jgi:hypothetical protein
MDKQQIRLISENKYPMIKRRWPKKWTVYISVDGLIDTFQLKHFYV